MREGVVVVGAKMDMIPIFLCCAKLGVPIISPRIICPRVLRKDRSVRREVDDPKKEDSDFKMLSRQLKMQKKWTRRVITD